MHIILTEDEMEWVDTSKAFAWKIKEECPQRIKDVLIKKLKMLNKHRENR